MNKHMRTVHHTYRRKVKIPRESGSVEENEIVPPVTPVKRLSNETKNQSGKKDEVKPAGQLITGLGLIQSGLDIKPVPAVRDADTETIKQELGIAYT